MHSSQRGQSLIEVLIVVLFIAMGVIALIRFQHYLAYNNTLIHQKSDAGLLALEKTEMLRDFQVLNTTSGYTAFQDITSSAGATTTVRGNTSYTITWVVTPHINPTYKTIDVTISWTDTQSNTQSIKLVTQTAGINPSNSASIM
ncbi:MAG: hypothetical protein WAW86_05320 [Gammaproteobacteria bacterium]